MAIPGTVPILPPMRRYGTGAGTLIDQQTAILTHLRAARGAMVEATPNLRDYRDHDDYQDAIAGHVARCQTLFAARSARSASCAVSVVTTLRLSWWRPAPTSSISANSV